MLGTTGVQLKLWSGAASSNEFYLYIDKKINKSPKLLVSYCTGGFNEVDIDLDGIKELISYGGGLPTNFFLIIKSGEKLKYTDYLYHNETPVYYDEATNDFYIIDETDTKIYMDFYKEEGTLIEK